MSEFLLWIGVVTPMITISLGLVIAFVFAKRGKSKDDLLIGTPLRNSDMKMEDVWKNL